MPRPIRDNDNIIIGGRDEKNACVRCRNGNGNIYDQCEKNDDEGVLSSGLFITTITNTIITNATITSIPCENMALIKSTGIDSSVDTLTDSSHQHRQDLTDLRVPNSSVDENENESEIPVPLSGSCVDGCKYQIENMAATGFLKKSTSEEDLSDSRYEKDVVIESSGVLQVSNELDKDNYSDADVCVSGKIHAVESDSGKSLYSDNEINTKGLCYRMTIVDVEKSQNKNGDMIIDRDKSNEPSSPSSSSSHRLEPAENAVSTCVDESHQNQVDRDTTEENDICGGKDDIAADVVVDVSRDQPSSLFDMDGNQLIQSGLSPPSNVIHNDDGDDDGGDDGGDDKNVERIDPKSVSRSDNVSNVISTNSKACLLVTEPFHSDESKTSSVTVTEFPDTAQSNPVIRPGWDDENTQDSVGSQRIQDQAIEPTLSSSSLPPSTPSQQHQPSPPISSPQSPSDNNLSFTTTVKARPCSPHLRRRFSTADDMSKTQFTHPAKDVVGTEADPETEVRKNPASSPITVTIPHTQNHQKSKMSMCGGCFHRIGNFGRKKKRKLSPREAIDNPNTIRDIYKSPENKENLEDGAVLYEKPKISQEDVDCKIPKVCEKETIVTPDVAEIKLDTNKVIQSDFKPETIDTTDTMNPHTPSFCYDDNNNDNNDDNNVNNASTDQNDTAKCVEKTNESVDESSKESLKPQEQETVEHSEEIDTVAATLLDDPFKFSRSRIRPGSFRFRRAFSQRNRMKPLLENVVSGGSGDKDANDDDDDGVIGDMNALQFTAAADGASGIAGRHLGGTFHRRAFSLKRHFHSSGASHHSSPTSEHTTALGSSGRNGRQKDTQNKNGDKHQRQHHHSQQLQRSQSLKTQLMSFFVNLHGNARASPLSRAGSVNK